MNQYSIKLWKGLNSICLGNMATGDYMVIMKSKSLMLSWTHSVLLIIITIYNTLKYERQLSNISKMQKEWYWHVSTVRITWLIYNIAYTALWEHKHLRQRSKSSGLLCVRWYCLMWSQLRFKIWSHEEHNHPTSYIFFSSGILFKQVIDYKLQENHQQNEDIMFELKKVTIRRHWACRHSSS